MPAQRPRAAFEPISPDLDVADLVDSTPNFEYVPRIHCDAIDANGLENFEKLVWLHVVLGGKPLVIEGFNQRLDSSIFSEKWLRSYYSMKNPNRQRIYLKDIDCPQQWHDHLKQLIPPPLFYLNKLPEMFEGPGAKTLPSNDDLLARSASGRPIAKAGDLMSCLPPFMRAENLMCYIGHEGTYTPAHQEMCASLGQNIMVEASDGSVEYGKATKPGSSIWFMTESKDRHVVAEYWMSTLGHDLDIEDHFAQINAWKAAPFKTYIVEQRPGDFLLVPPLAAHQVWNRGTRTMKVAWNRTIAKTLELALFEALPHARMVCRDEQYKNKAIVFYSLDHYSDLLSEVGDSGVWGLRVQLLLEDFELLFELYTQILLSESFLHDPPKDDIEYVPFDSNITCSYCRGNIFNRFLTCPWCIGEGDDTYDICMECYTMGRSCACISKLQWVEQFRWSELTGKYEKWRQQLLRFVEAKSDKYPCLPAKRAQLGRKTLAEICHEQMKRRPWFDVTNPDTMEMYHWMCPRCQKICSCAACRRDPTMNPYEPTCTLLGHDTRKVADPRSVESLVDFRQSNLRWLKKAGDDEEGRLKKHQKEADEKRNKALVDNCIELEFPQAVSEGPESVKLASPAAGYFNDYSEIPVDPALEKLDGSSLHRKPSVSDMCRFAGEGQKALQT
ncbi:hypothetical protein APSETT444_000672 [Aspergillus pseudonomiae]